MLMALASVLVAVLGGVGVGAAEAHHQRPGTDHHGQGGEGQGQLVNDQQHTPRPSNSEGPPTTWTEGSTDPGARATATSSNSGTATLALAHQRQPGEGSFPVGVNSSTKPSRSSPQPALAG